MNHRFRRRALLWVASIFSLLAANASLHGAAGLPSSVYRFEPGRAFQAAAVRADGTFLAGGENYLAHVSEDGRRLPDFAAPLLTGSRVTALALASDGAVFVGGILVYPGSSAPNQASVIKLKPDGCVDSTFAAVNFGAAARIASIASDNAGGCFVAGDFTQAAGVSARGLVHLNAAGSIQVLPGRRAAGDIPLLIASAPRGLIVVQTQQIYSVTADGTTTTWDAPSASNPTQIAAATYDPTYGLAVAGLQGGTNFCFVYNAEGHVSPAFAQVMRLQSGPSVLAWDRSGRMLIGGSELVGQSVFPEVYGVHRLLPDGRADLTWTRAPVVAGEVTAVVPLRDSVIVSGAISVPGITTTGACRLSAESLPVRIANQSVLGSSAPPSFTLGFVVQGDYAVEAYVRAVGPTLANYGIAHPAARTALKIFAGPALRATVNARVALGPEALNEPTFLRDAAVRLGAFPLNLGGYNEAETLVVLAPGAYTIAVSSFTNDGGMILAEVYFN